MCTFLRQLATRAEAGRKNKKTEQGHIEGVMHTPQPTVESVMVIGSLG